MRIAYFAAVEYIVRALKLRVDGLPNEIVERCTGIPHNLQDDILPLAGLIGDKSDDLAGSVREAAKSMSAENIAIVQIAIELWWDARTRATVRDRRQPIAVESGAVADRVAQWARDGKGLTGPSTIDTGFIGLQDDPLPTESSVSLALRLLTANATSWGAATKLFGIKLFKTGYFGKPLFVSFSGSAIPLPWLDTEDKRLFAQLPYTSGMILNDRFRFCPDCISCRFHSTLHQINLAETCPVHGTRLTEVCIACGNTVGDFEQLLRRGHKAYHCSKCERPLAGQAMTYREYRDFRNQVSALEKRLELLVRWFRDAPARLWPLEQLLEQNRGSVKNWINWGFTTDSVAKTAHRFHPLPMQPTTSPAYEMIIMPWALRSREAIGEVPQQFSDWVYLSTVRRILDWVNADMHIAPAFGDFDDLEYNVLIKRDDAGLRRMALAYFRRSFEEYRIHSEKWASFQPKTPNLRVTVDGYGTYAIPRLARKASLIGAYAMVLAAMKLRQREGFHRSQLGGLNFARPVPTVVLPEHKLSPYLTFREGAVFAPAVDGLPIASLYRGRS
ncbi:TniQ family protein [Trinickia mobilis]|uniref:TniQ family protein n=1 Tax=Trinickia mobilis TaxID=2816356 RepID=UPI001A8CBB9D|nr:TniQ family protein [Trinickia mobilis]